MNDKPRLVIVGMPELAYLLAHQGELDIPALYNPVGQNKHLYVGSADELRAWRSANTSTGKAE